MKWSTQNEIFIIRLQLTLTWSDICAIIAAMSGECRLMSEARRNISWSRGQIRSHTDHGPFPSQTRSVNPRRWTGVLWLVTQRLHRSLVGSKFTLAPTYSHERGHPSSILYLVLTIIRVILIANLKKKKRSTWIVSAFKLQVCKWTIYKYHWQNSWLLGSCQSQKGFSILDCITRLYI